MAANKGDVEAQSRVAKLYMKGLGVEKNPVEAVRWHLLARESGMKDQELEIFAAALETNQLAKAQRLALDWRRTTGIKPNAGRNSSVAKGSTASSTQSQ